MAFFIPLAAAASDTPTDRPRVGLVLSGGGAKGMAHVGVLRVLEEMNIPVDMVVGTSAGSAVGALYASGMSVAEIERRFVEMDWLSSFRDDPGRAYKPLRRKQGEWRYPVTPGLGVSLDGLHLGAGIIAGQNLGFILNELTHNVALVEDFDRLPIPFRAVATDLETGDMVVLGRGNLAAAIRASMSIPGVYAPAKLNGRLLVDGGVAANLPISVARDMGADVIIAVDITDTLMGPDKLREAFSIFGQLTTIMTRRNTEQQLDLLGDKDVLIRPDLEGHSSADFYNALVLFELGASGARAHAVELNPLTVANEAWQAYRSRLAAATLSAGVVTNIEVKHERRLGREFLRERIQQKTGEPLDVGVLEEDLKRIYGLGYYETVSYSQTPSPDGTRLIIEVQEKSWGPNYLSFGLNYEDNFDGDTRFNLASSLRITELNELGAEWQTGVQLGTEPRIRSQWYQPLDYGYERFLVAGTQYSRDTFSVYGTEGERVAELDVTFRQVDLGLGMELGGNAEVRFEYVRGYATVDQQLGTAAVPEGAVHQGNVSLQLVHDSLDDAFFPRDGAFAGIRGRVEREDLGSDRHFDSATGMALGTGSWKGFTLTGLLFAHTVTRGEPGIENAIRLGGFRRLSAYAPGQITGDSAGMASVYASQAFGGPITPWFAGMGLEAGNAWESLSDAGWNRSVKSWSVFAGLDTFLGPVQIATAYSNKDNWVAYLNIGFSFTQLFY
ncbi:patatin-like phospholipase family protein [Marinobacter sp.]|uniref:patatin-like phospholipase family protein n=1 Tax=Marinobacter sp. TaxID=50741 RepID=UPI001B3CC33B|nr:patatin-like phospholipase family protein [Marinobacter sp.]MBQ0833340.1 patatin-like phospholipase family protein [Marinobacter sp.]